MERDWGNLILGLGEGEMAIQGLGAKSPHSHSFSDLAL